jgi:two-component system, response regulator PdtaR
VAQILFVEDDVVVRHGIARMLEAAGHSVTVAGSGSGALGQAAAREFELAVLDVGLPDFDGIQCAKRLRAAGFAGAIVFLTAYDTPEFVRDSVALRAHAYLVKPITGAQLLPIVQTALAAALDARRQEEKFVEALNVSREISAAVGVLAERHGWTIDHAFQALRTMARSQSRKIADVAIELIAQRPQKASSAPDPNGKSGSK